MSDHIPFELQLQIMKSLPVKSLIQFRSVSKQWKSVIDSPNFIADYTNRHHSQPQHHHLLIRYQNPSSEQQYVSIFDDDSFPQNKHSPHVPNSVNLLRDSTLIGISHGLLCLFGYYRNPDDFDIESGTPMAVVWNLSIRKSVAIVMPDVDWFNGGPGFGIFFGFGFGVCRTTSDPKIVQIDCSNSQWQVEVFSLRSRVWRSSSSYINTNNNNQARLFFDFRCQVTVDGFIYWCGFRTTHLLISFDLSSEEFREIRLPYELAHTTMVLSLFKRSDSLALLKSNKGVYEVWMMENGCSNSFTMLFAINESCVSSLPLEFRRNGEFMMSIKDDTEDAEALIVYEPFSERINDLGIRGQHCSLSVTPYTDSLMLLD